MHRRAGLVGSMAALLLGLPPAPGLAQLAEVAQDRGANGLALALRKAGTTARVLYVTAHPDDEHNGMLVRLARGQGVRTALLTVTRGDGGQNEIGEELFDAIGVLRTEELLASHRYQDVEQYFGQASDFGYSFSVEESLARWGREETLGDVVRVVRAFRPDVILTLPLDAPGGGMHHQAAASLAREAFRAAADAARFPAHAREGLRPWQARRIYAAGTTGASGGGDAPLSLTTATYDPLLGMSWQALGSEARAMHRSQGVSQLRALPGTGEARYLRIDAEPPSPAAADADVLDGIETGLPGLLRFAPGHEAATPALAPALREIEARLAAARQAFDPAAPERTQPSLQAALLATRKVMGDVAASSLAEAARAELADRLKDEEKDLQQALVRAHGIALEVLLDDDLVEPGQLVAVTTRVVNQGPAAVHVEDVAVTATEGWATRRAEGAPRELGRGETLLYRHEVTVAATAPPSQPYWRRDPARDRYAVRDPRFVGLPWAPPDITATVTFRSGEASVTAVVPAVWRYEWAGGGEKQKVVQVVPAVTVRLQPEILVVPTGAPRPREVRAVVASGARAEVRPQVSLEVPAGWRVEPAHADAALRFEGDEATLRFTVTPPSALAAGAGEIRAVARLAGREYREGATVVAYEHTQERRLYAPARMRVMAVDVTVPAGIQVGYVRGPGDQTADALRQLGVPVTELGADDLAFADLSRFTTIVTGVRAYQTRADLKAAQDRLLQFMEAGGHVVVQYNKFEFNVLYERPQPGGFSGQRAQREALSPFAPYPAQVTSERVSDETAPPRILAAAEPVLNVPNRLTAADWEGWVQERGLYFLGARDPRYVQVMAFTDPFPKNAGEKTGALVVAPVGRGTWTYVGLGLFRQLPAGVPGAYRLLANLVSRPRGK